MDVINDLMDLTFLQHYDINKCKTVHHFQPTWPVATLISRVWNVNPFSKLSDC